MELRCTSRDAIDTVAGQEPSNDRSHFGAGRNRGPIRHVDAAYGDQRHPGTPAELVRPCQLLETRGWAGALLRCRGEHGAEGYVIRARRNRFTKLSLVVRRDPDAEVGGESTGVAER